MPRAAHSLGVIFSMLRAYRRVIRSQKYRSVICVHFNLNYCREQRLSERMLMTIRNRGVVGLYRGIGPGTLRSFLANGTSMIVMSNAQKLVTKLGLRE